EARQELRGERTGIRYALGTRVQVQVSRVDLDGRRIDFRLVQGDEDLLQRAMRDKAGDGAPGQAGEAGGARGKVAALLAPKAAKKGASQGQAGKEAGRQAPKNRNAPPRSRK